MDSEFGVVPVQIQIQAQVSFPLPIFGDFVILLEGIHEIMGMFLANVLHSEIIHAKREIDWMLLMLPKSGAKLTFKITHLFLPCLEDFLG